MADRWIYRHAGSVKGPVSHEQLKKLAAGGELLPADLVWPEGGDPRRAVEAQAVLNFADVRRATEAAGAWLGKVAQALAAPPPQAPAAAPDWLSDVQQADAGAPPPVPPALAGPSTPLPRKVATAIAPTPGTSGFPPVDLELVLLPRSPVVAPPTSRVVPYPPRLLIGGASSRGRVRERNEDRFQTQQWNWNDADKVREIALLVVADGMGGYQAGDEAASLTVRTVVTHLGTVVAGAISGGPVDGSVIAAAIDQAIREANRIVHRLANTEAKYKGMGATAALVVVLDGVAYFSHVGDCRVYLHRGNELKQLTEDQTLVARMVAVGKLTAEEAAKHEAKNEVTQAVGKRATIEPTRAEQALRRGDYLVVACDGLAAHVADLTIRQVLSLSSVPPPHLASHLVSMADEGGGTDNCTVVVAHFA